MKWQPTLLKYRKYQKIKNKKKITVKNYFLKLGNYGLKAKKNGFLSSIHLEMIRRHFSKLLKKKNKKKCFIRVFPYKVFTKKAKGVRMGKGKGKTYKWVASIYKGQVFLEIKKIHKKLLDQLLEKMPFKCCVIKKKI